MVSNGLTLVFTDILTAFEFFHARKPSFAQLIRRVNFSLRLDEAERWSREDREQVYAASKRLTVNALAELPGLAEVNLWVDSSDKFPLRHMRAKSNLLRWPPSLLPILSLDCPASDSSDLDWIQRYFEEPLPTQRLRRRGYPRYYVDLRGELRCRDDEPIESFSDSDSSDTHHPNYRLRLSPRLADKYPDLKKLFP
jgi:hypothetical protein